MKRSVAVPIYFGTLITVVEKDLQDAARLVGIESDVTGFGALARRRKTKGGFRQYSIIFSGKTTIPELVHEAKHIVNFIFEDCDINLDLKNDEPECYLLTWVFKQVYDTWLKYHKR